MSIIVENRTDGSYSLFIDGDLQFDTRDEKIYHELLALPALSLAKPLDPEEGLHVLICGGGDGLALRECVRFPGVASVDLVDYDPEIVELGRTRFAEQNLHAFEDPRVTVYIQDAWEHLKSSHLYDVILLDFTVPMRAGDDRVFSQEWYERVGSALAPEGVVSLNSISPQMCPEAFWCLHKTVAAAKLKPAPFRACIPSFYKQGFGIWAFILASKNQISTAQLKAIDCPVEAGSVDLKQLWRGSKFTLQERSMQKQVPVNRVNDLCYLSLSLNPGTQSNQIETQLANSDDPFDLTTLMQSIPITHPYHTREMIETLADQVIGSAEGVDLPRRVDALLDRAARLADNVVEELKRLKEMLRDRLSSFITFRHWASRLFAILIALMTIANAVAPDNAFAKGFHGSGSHASIGRGYVSSYRGSGGSFTGTRGTGGSFGAGAARGSSFGSARTTAVGGRRTGSFGYASQMSSSGFRRGYSGRSGIVDMQGTVYNPRTFSYCGSGFGHYHSYYFGNGGYQHGSRPADSAPPITQQARFAADEDMLVMENGDVVIVLSDDAFLLVNEGKVALFNSKQTDPLLPVFASKELFDAIRTQLTDQKEEALDEIKLRQDWLFWVDWTSVAAPSVREDKSELANLKDLVHRIDIASERLGQPSEDASIKEVPDGAVEIFAGGFLLPRNEVIVRAPDGSWNHFDRQEIWSDSPGTPRVPTKPIFLQTVKSITIQIEKELVADDVANADYLRTLEADMASLQSDLSSYSALQSANGGSYEVDYGTDEIPADEAITKTNFDISQTQTEIDDTTKDQVKIAAERQIISEEWTNLSIPTSK